MDVTRNLARLAKTSANRLRAVPTFLIIGAQKSGTSALYRYLLSHPNIIGAAWRKEVHYFDKSYDRGMNWYRSHFPYRYQINRLAKSSQSQIHVGEATPYYLFHPLCARRIHRHLPSVQLIAILRNPVERAWSHYQMECRAGRETRTFQEAIENERASIHVEEQILLSGTQTASATHQHTSYLSRGLYAQQLERYLDLFEPNKVMVLQAERLLADPQTQFDRVLHRLGIGEHRLERATPVHVGGYDRSSPIPMRRQLDRMFEEPNKHLYELIRQELDW